MKDGNTSDSRRITRKPAVIDVCGSASDSTGRSSLHLSDPVGELSTGVNAILKAHKRGGRIAVFASSHRVALLKSCSQKFARDSRWDPSRAAANTEVGCVFGIRTDKRAWVPESTRSYSRQTVEVVREAPEKPAARRWERHRWPYSWVRNPTVGPPAPVPPPLAAAMQTSWEPSELQFAMKNVLWRPVTLWKTGSENRFPDVGAPKALVAQESSSYSVPFPCRSQCFRSKTWYYMPSAAL